MGNWNARRERLADWERPAKKSAGCANEGRLRGLFVCVLFGGLALFLAGCDSLGPMPTPIPAATPTPNVLEQSLAQIPNAVSFRIRDDWAGLAIASPRLSHYTLTRGPDGIFTGTAEYTAGHAGGEGLSATEAITIPADVAQAFLAKLAAPPLVEGDYVPKQEHTDDYPNIAMQIDLPQPLQVVSIYTQSQGETHAPWAAAIGGKSYVIDAPDPNDAYTLLTPHLKKEVLQQLVAQAEGR